MGGGEGEGHGRPVHFARWEKTESKRGKLYCDKGGVGVGRGRKIYSIIGKSDYKK